MIDIKITINGQPATSANIKDAFERAAYEGIRKKITEKLRNIDSSADGKQLQVELIGKSLNDLSVSLSGPKELIEKAKVALGVS